MQRHLAIPAAACALVLCAFGLAACGATGALDATTSTTSTTTTTTLPVAIPVYGTGTSGTVGFEGKVRRIPVPLLAAGATELPAHPASSGVGAVRIAFRQFGSGPDLVLAAGQHASMTWWDPQLLATLAASYRVTIFDYPSIGYSTPLGRAPDVEHYGDALAGLVDSLGLHNVTLLGWGMGGEVALSAVERHPGLAIGLVLVDTTMGGPHAAPAARGATATVDRPDATMAELAQVLFPASPAGDQARAVWLADISAIASDVVTFPELAAQALAARRFRASDRVALRIGRVAVPTLVFSGAEDALFPVTDARQLASAIAGARLVVEPGAGYGAIFQDASAFVADLATFMAKVTLSTTTTTTPAS